MIVDRAPGPNHAIQEGSRCWLYRAAHYYTDYCMQCAQWPIRYCSTKKHVIANIGARQVERDRRLSL